MIQWTSENASIASIRTSNDVNSSVIGWYKDLFDQFKVEIINETIKESNSLNLYNKSN